MVWVFLIVVFVVGLPVGGGLMYAGWKSLLESRPPDPIGILAARYARGEIGEEEYARRMQVLLAGLGRELPAG